MSNLQDLQVSALEIARKYDELNQKAGRGKWDSKDYAMGFVGDVGDLLKLVMAKEGLRGVNDVDTKLAHELSDCLWSILVLADQYNIDLEKEFTNTMNELKTKIGEARA
jgi:NTP pyrophosphatase (non-canonical NTP hydrolase)